MAYDEQHSDAELVSAANRGDVAAFEALYERYRAWVAGLAHRFTRDDAAAQDITQEAFLWLLRKFPGFELRAKMKSVLYPVVRSMALTRARRPAEAELPDIAAKQDRVPDATLATRLAAALDSLAAGEREALILRFADDLSLQEISVALGVPLGTVKSRLHNGLRAMREHPALKFDNFS